MTPESPVYPHVSIVSLSKRSSEIVGNSLSGAELFSTPLEDVILTAKDLRERLCDKLGANPSMVTLFCGARPLKDEEAIDDIGAITVKQFVPEALRSRWRTSWTRKLQQQAALDQSSAERISDVEPQTQSWGPALVWKATVVNHGDGQRPGLRGRLSYSPTIRHCIANPSCAVLHGQQKEEVSVCKHSQ